MNHRWPRYFVKNNFVKAQRNINYVGLSIGLTSQKSEPNGMYQSSNFIKKEHDTIKVPFGLIPVMLNCCTESSIIFVILQLVQVVLCMQVYRKHVILHISSYLNEGNTALDSASPDPSSDSQPLSDPTQPFVRATFQLFNSQSLSKLLHCISQLSGGFGRIGCASGDWTGAEEPPVHCSDGWN